MADVAVVGVPDDLWGELVVAVVVPAADDGSQLYTAALEAHCRAALAGYKIPRRWEQSRPCRAMPTARCSSVSYAAS